MQQSLTLVKNYNRQSKSLPTINPKINTPPLSISKLNSLKSTLSQHRCNKHTLPLNHLYSKQQQNIYSKVKIIAEQNQCKLKGRYDAIGQQKKKHVFEGLGLLLKQKIVDDNNKAGAFIKYTDTVQNQWSEKDEIGITDQNIINPCLLPTISKNYLDSIVAERQMRGAHFQILIKNKLLKGNKYYQSNCNSKQKIKIKRFQTIIPPQKDRELQLNQFLNKISVIKNEIINKKIILSEPYRKVKVGQLENLKDANKNLKLKGKQQTILNEHQAVKIKKTKKPQILRQKLLGQLLQEEPEGWKIVLNAHQTDDDII